VGYLHEGLSAREQANVHDKFVIEAIHQCLSMKSLQLAMSIQGCVAPSSMCWGMTLSAHLVVILGS
jgi:pre-mRNA-splicing helicase BRR2